MYMEQLEGTIDKNSKEVLLRFESKFLFSIGDMLKFPKLIVKTLLTSGKVKGKSNMEGELVEELQRENQEKIKFLNMIMVCHLLILENLFQHMSLELVNSFHILNNNAHGSNRLFITRLPLLV